LRVGHPATQFGAPAVGPCGYWFGERQGRVEESQSKQPGTTVSSC
jgi:hypothetical protein